MINSYRNHVYVFLAAFGFSLLTVLSLVLTNQRIDVFNQVIWRMAMGSLAAFLIARFGFRQQLSLSYAEVKLLAIQSLVLIFAVMTFSGAIYLGTPIAKAVMLNYAYPLSVVLFTYLVFRELPSRRQWLAIGLSLVSLVFLLEVWTVDSLTQFHPGDVLAFLHSIFYAALIVWGAKIRKTTHTSSLKIVAYSFLAAIPGIVLFGYLFRLLGFSLYAAPLRFDFSAVTWLTFLAISLFGSTVPTALAYAALSKLKPYLATVLLLTEPVWVYLFGLFLFGQQLSIWGILGGVGILASILLV